MVDGVFWPNTWTDCLPHPEFKTQQRGVSGPPPSPAPNSCSAVISVPAPLGSLRPEVLTPLRDGES